VHLIAAEDTRHSRHLLTHFNITTPLQALHEHNEKQMSQVLLQQLQKGEDIALISDAGTPLISDPGHYLIQLAHEQHIQVTPIPGASALISALSVAGFRADKFVFEGFLPPKPHARMQRLEFLQSETRTLVFYEAPHRIISCLDAMESAFGNEREAVLVKELTKVFETVKRDKLTALKTWLQQKSERQKGEFVIIIAGHPEEKIPEISTEALHILKVLKQNLPLKQAAKLTSEITGISKNKLYELGLQ
jgi:16S rRNA (cytidine1402-2'-O)-methyltransferase